MVYRQVVSLWQGIAVRPTRTGFDDTVDTIVDTRVNVDSRAEKSGKA